MSDFLIDPSVGDYVLDDVPSFMADPAGGLANAVYLRLMVPLSSYWKDPSLGSRLHEIQREKDLSRVGLLAKQYAEQALQPIIDDGRATAIEVEPEQPHNGWLILHITVHAASGNTFNFKHAVKVL